MSARVDYDAITERTCSRCGELKPVSEFNRHKSWRGTERILRVSSWCRQCLNERARVYGTENRPRRNARLRAWRQANPEAARSKDKRTRLATKYGLTEDQVQVLLDRYDGLCWVCRRRKAVVVEHDHATEIVRGMTCQTCNGVLAKTDADPEYLEKVDTYLKEARGGSVARMLNGDLA